MKNDMIRSKWDEFENEYLQNIHKYTKEIDNQIKRLKIFMDTYNKIPNKRSDDKHEKQLGQKLLYYKGCYKKKTRIMGSLVIRIKWDEFTNEYKKYLNKSKKSMTKPKIAKKKQSETQTQGKERVKSEMSILHQKYKTMNSQNLHTHFEEHPDDWEEYHKISKNNEESFPDDEIPRNKMINYLENLPGKKQKVIADLGCGFAEINQNFKDNNRFTFHNFDHHSPNEFVTERDIQNTELEDYSIDIAILSLAMWGSNCKDYLKEVYRILDTGGILLIAEAYKRWNKELDDDGNPVNKLVNLLKEHNFNIKECIEQKFMFIECVKQ